MQFNLHCFELLEDNLSYRSWKLTGGLWPGEIPFLNFKQLYCLSSYILLWVDSTFTGKFAKQQSRDRRIRNTPSVIKILNLILPMVILGGNSPNNSMSFGVLERYRAKYIYWGYTLCKGKISVKFFSISNSSRGTESKYFEFSSLVELTTRL